MNLIEILEEAQDLLSLALQHPVVDRAVRGAQLDRSSCSCRAAVRCDELLRAAARTGGRARRRAMRAAR
jgi:hypothetical protein